MLQDPINPIGADAETRHRLEDARFLIGRGTFIADRSDPANLHAAFVRSPHAHARIVRIRHDEIASEGSVLALFAGADLIGRRPVQVPTGIELSRPDGKPAPCTPRFALAVDVVRYVGEPVAMLIGQSLPAVLEAADRVEIEYEPLSAIASIAEARMVDAPAPWDEAPDNVAFVWRGGQADDVANVLRQAQHVTDVTLNISRVTANPIEPRGLLAVPHDDGGLTLHISHQSPHLLHAKLAEVFGFAPGQLRILCGDVGGSFGMKAGIYPEEVAVLWAAIRLRRSIGWIATRTESLQADEHARDVRVRAKLALDNGLFSALQVRLEINSGAYVSERSIVSLNNVGGIAGVYRIPHISAEVVGLVTNTAPVGPYRGAGRPEATYVIERIIDVAARECGVDPFDLRYRNLIAAAALPYRTSFVFTYDTGDFPGNMDQAALIADMPNFPARRRQSAERGRLRGLGICNPIEVAGGPFLKPGTDYARAALRPDGTVVLDVGVMSTGQGLETVFSTLAARRFGIRIDRIIYRQGDTGQFPTGRGSGGSAGLSVGGTALARTLDALFEAALSTASDALEASPTDIELVNGRFTVAGTDRSISLGDVAKRSEAAGHLLVEKRAFQPDAVNFPNGCHICEVEVDPETGEVTVLSYVAVEDVGKVINEQLLHGQIHGGIVQGIGQALGEQIVHEGESAQLLTGSFMDYAMPRARSTPPIRIVSREIPTTTNALGVKGVGEAGTVGALAATINAVCDALAIYGIYHIDMPATPARIWACIEAARKRDQVAG